MGGFVAFIFAYKKQGRDFIETKPKYQLEVNGIYHSKKENREILNWMKFE
jgi:hypothetical protein